VLWGKSLTFLFLLTGFVVEHSDIVFIAVKPQILDSAVDNMKATLCQPVPAKLFVSILAGTTLEVLEKVDCLLI
jgi:pyrroline-5-carboxylate reductase